MTRGRPGPPPGETPSDLAHYQRIAEAIVPEDFPLVSVVTIRADCADAEAIAVTKAREWREGGYLVHSYRRTLAVEDVQLGIFVIVIRRRPPLTLGD